jgi:hypothetical protein
MVNVPESELRLILGENAGRFYKLDRDMLPNQAERTGLQVSEIQSREPVGAELI